MMANDPVKALELIAADAVDLAHQNYIAEDTLEASQLCTAARVFKHALEVYVINREQDQKRNQ